MTYFLMLVAVFLWAFVIAGKLLQDSELSAGAAVVWMLLLASLATFFFHNIM